MLDKARSNSGISAVAPITGGQAEETDTRTVGSSARIDGRQSGVSVRPVIIVVGPAFAASAELGVAVIMLILAPSLGNTYHPAYLMCFRSVDHAARRWPG